MVDIRREVCVLKSARLIPGGKFAFCTKDFPYIKGKIHRSIGINYSYVNFKWTQVFLCYQSFDTLACSRLRDSGEKYYVRTILSESKQAAQAHYLWVRASEVIWWEYTRIISVLSDAK